MKHHQCSPTLYTEEGSGDLQGDRRDDPDGGQERGREDQLQRVQGDDGSSPTYNAWSVAFFLTRQNWNL